MKRESRGYYEFPKGAIKIGESEEDALFGELEQEADITKYDIVMYSRIAMRYSKKSRHNGEVYDFSFYLVRAKEPKTPSEVALKNGEHSEAGWYGIKETEKKLEQCAHVEEKDWALLNWLKGNDKYFRQLLKEYKQAEISYLELSI